MKSKNYIFGLILILLAVNLIGNNMGWFDFGTFGLFSIIFTIIFAGMLIHGMINLHFGEILFSLAFLAIIYSDPLGLDEITPFPVLFAALLGTIGLDMIFKEQIDRRRIGRHHDKGDHFSGETSTDYGETIYCGVNFGSMTKYANGQSFKSADVDCNFGEVKLYLEKAILSDNRAEVYVQTRFGETTIFVPREWKVNINKRSVFCADVKEVGRYERVENAAELDVFINVAFGDVVINYI